ncbi:MAG: hypothetical protein IBJ03_07020 [Gemmatimonadaceae bacterium]|nr:hypothetical protein [Gemmatimonadaceae bacterium]
MNLLLSVPMLVRPQPIGIYPFPAGLLLLPEPDTQTDADRAIAREAHEALMRGALPEIWPDAWRFFAAALQGDREEAMALLTTQDVAPDTAVAAYNRFVLAGDAGDLAAALGATAPSVRIMSRCAAFVQGAVSELPSPEEIDNALDAELAGQAMAVQAAWYLEHHAIAEALTALTQGTILARDVSPVLAAQLLAQRAGLEDSAATAESLWQEALQLAGDSPLPGLRAELLCGRAMVVHQESESLRHRLVEAIQLYQEALRAGIDRDSHPMMWARIQANLGIAYVSMPMSEAGDKLRLAVALQAFREALTVYDRKAHPDEWASTMLNMANAMQYMPSAHQQENLMQAVEAYEELLTVRPRAMDPVGYARIIANQGTALAHLGIFAPAVEKLTEAHKLLHWHGEPDAAQRLLDQLEAINIQLATAGSA